ncbi:hypothetical protein GCM10009525_02090 [Streptosporangium amethystogenes subsp. fukuiense]
MLSTDQAAIAVAPSDHSPQDKASGHPIPAVSRRPVIATTEASSTNTTRSGMSTHFLPDRVSPGHKGDEEGSPTEDRTRFWG